MLPDILSGVVVKNAGHIFVADQTVECDNNKFAIQVKHGQPNRQGLAVQPQPQALLAIDAPIMTNNLPHILKHLSWCSLLRDNECRHC